MPPPKRSSFPAHRIKCAGFQIGMGGGGKPPALRKTSSFTGNKLVGTHISYLLSKTKNRPKNEAVLRRRVYKPGSVLTAIYLAPQLLTGSSRLLGTVGQTHCPSTALLRDRVYIVKPMSPWAGCALTAPFHPCSADAGRYLSVALVLRFPSAGVTRYPCPVEPGLSSSGSFRFPSAAVQPSLRELF